jgi:uncharacterized protein (DUF4213/DUF364 family)
MTIRGTIRELLSRACTDLAVRDVRLGLGYSAVRLDDDRTGVAYTFRDNHVGGCSVFQGARPLAGKPARDLLEFLESSDKIESALGLATANAVANTGQIVGLPGDVLEAVEMLPTDRVGMIGFFGPLIPALENRVRKLFIFEETAESSPNLLPSSEATNLLPECDIALITSTTIINGTIDNLLEAASRCRETVLLGSSTPCVPEAFQDTPVSLLSGMTVVDSTGILQVVSEGGGTRFFKPFVKKWNVRLREGS